VEGSVADVDGTITWVGNATVLLELGPFTVLTDPNFLHAGQRVHLGYGLTSKRLREPAMQPEDLPDLDAVVLSHLHGDHWDRVATRRLDRDLPVITTPHAARRLQGLRGFHRATGLRTWQQHELLRDGMVLRVTALPGMHAPGLLGKALPPVMGSMVELGDAGGEVVRRVYLTGDTLMFPGLQEIARRYPEIPVAVVHLGGTRLPGGKMVTMDGKQGTELVQLLRPGVVHPVHTDDYDVFTSPPEDFVTEMAANELAGHVRMLTRGEPTPLGF
jgi:L-ascorbate metabolism protein UlaG (beta-lactamase superfamily)